MTEDFKSVLKQALPEKIIEVFEDYRLLLPSASADIKAFGAYHTACKNALAHIWMMIKLLTLVEGDPERNECSDWLSKAKEALKSEENDDDTL